MDAGSEQLTLHLSGRRGLALCFIALAAGLLAIGGAMDWGMAGLFWAGAIVLCIAAKGLWPATTIMVNESGELLWQRGNKKPLRIDWHGELWLMPMSGWYALILKNPDFGDTPLCTWRKLRTCEDIAQQLGDTLYPLPIRKIDATDLELAKRYGGSPADQQDSTSAQSPTQRSTAHQSAAAMPNDTTPPHA